MADVEPITDEQPQGTLLPSLNNIRLDALAGSARFKRMDMYEAYWRSQQYDGRKYDWDGRFRGYGEAADISPGWYVPLKLRRPAARKDLPKLIVKRFTSLLFGQDRWPGVKVDGDEEAEDFVKALIEESKLPTKIREARNLGGACGSVGLSFGFLEGKPRVTVHNAKHITVLRWVDRYELTVGAVLESYVYYKTLWGPDGRPKQVPYYYARYWDTEREIIWEPIAGVDAKDPRRWVTLPRREVEHGYGFTPFYWIQNLPDSQEVDGESDFESLCDNFDEINKLVSGSSRATLANMDPTLVVNEDPGKNPGTVRKGSENAIFAKGGASYLELKGESIRTAKELADGMQVDALDVAGVILADPEKMSGKAQSAAAIRLLYMPMLTVCDTLREQYGLSGLVKILLGMVRAARQIMNQEPGPILATIDGQRIQQRPTLKLPDRIVYEDQETETGELDEDGQPVMESERVSKMVPRVPGVSENIVLVWGPYFPNTWQDTKMAVEAIQAAGGGKAVISRRTAVTNAASLFGVRDVDQELTDIEDDSQRAADRAFGAGPMGDEIFDSGGKGNQDQPGDGNDDGKE